MEPPEEESVQDEPAAPSQADVAPLAPPLADDDDGLPLTVLFARGHAAFRDLERNVNQAREHITLIALYKYMLQ